MVRVKRNDDKKLRCPTWVVVLCGFFCPLLVVLLWSTLYIAIRQTTDTNNNASSSYSSAVDVTSFLLQPNNNLHTAGGEDEQEPQDLQELLNQERMRVQTLQRQLEDLHSNGVLAAEGGAKEDAPSKPCQPQQPSQPQSQNHFEPQNPICQSLPHPIPNAAALWTQYLPQIHQASQLPNDHRFYFHDFTAQLLQLMSPRLPASVKTVPRNEDAWPKLDELLTVAYERYQYVTYDGRWPTDKPIPRPVKIVIMGGSLLVGMNCRKLVADLGFQLRLPLADCSWANRLEKVINQFLLGKLLEWGPMREKQLQTDYIVHVHKIAMGGTNTVRLWFVIF